MKDLIARRNLARWSHDLKIDSIKVKPGHAPGLAERDTRSRLGLTGKTEAAMLHGELLGRMQVLQNHLWAEQRRSLLLVLQGMDASGKDGTIRAVFSGINPQGVSGHVVQGARRQGGSRTTICGACTRSARAR